MKNKLARRELLLGGLTAFRKALPGWKYEFPKDHFSHSEFQTEWWYYTGNLFTQTQRPFGFELTFFRQALLTEVEQKSIWSTRDAFMAHLALTDVEGKQFYHAERLNRPGPGLAGVDPAQRRIWNGNWSCELGETLHRLKAFEPRFSFELDLKPVKAPVIHGETGISVKGELLGQASHYISFPRLETQGQIHLGGQNFDVKGNAWMDHEFFSSEMDTGLAGWDWFSIQLHDNTELMLYRLRRKDGSTGGYSAGSFIDAQGKLTRLTAKDLQLTPGRKWQAYPVEWQIEIPRLKLSLACRPRLDAQELASRSKLTPSYWEGAVVFTGTHQGSGYLEMTGYDTELRFLRRDAPRKQ